MKFTGKLTIEELKEITNQVDYPFTLETQSSMVDVIIETDAPQLINRLIAKGLKKWNTQS